MAKTNRKPILPAGKEARVLRSIATKQGRTFQRFFGEDAHELQHIAESLAALRDMAGDEDGEINFYRPNLHALIDIVYTRAANLYSEVTDRDEEREEVESSAGGAA